MEALYLRHTGATTPPDYFLLFDDLVPTAPARLDWLLHTYGDLAVQGNVITVTQDEAAADVTLLAPTTFQHEIAAKSFQEAGVEVPFPTAKAVTFVKVHPTDVVTSGHFLAVLAPRRAGEKAVLRPTVVQAPGVLGAKLSRGPTHDLAVFALDAPKMEAEGVKCAGRTCFVRRGPGGILAAAMHHGTRLEAGGQLLLAADDSGHMTWSVGERELTTTIAMPQASKVTLFAPRKPKTARVDGKPVPFRDDASTKRASGRKRPACSWESRLKPARSPQHGATAERGSAVALWIDERAGFSRLSQEQAGRLRPEARCNGRWGGDRHPLRSRSHLP